MEALFALKGLKTYCYDEAEKRFLRIVDDVAFEIGKGETVALFGESGSGKTSIAYSIMGIVPHLPGIIRGKIYFKGKNLLEGLEEICHIEDNGDELIIEKDVNAWNRVFGYEASMKQIRGREIAIILQGAVSGLNPFHKLRLQIEEAYLLNGRNRSGMKETIDNLLLRLNLTRKQAELYPHNLSGGMCQRMMIAMAMIAEPDLLIADEPTTGIDPPLRMQILKLLQEFSMNNDRSLLFISHDLEAVKLLSQSVVVICHGKVVETCPTEIIKQGKSLHPYTNALIEAHEIIHDNKGLDASEENSISSSDGCSFYSQCRIREEICLKEEPELVLVDPELNHSVRCHKWVTAQYPVVISGG
ncbi:ABC transporter ATP-binding protein [bacterium]|nr:ABC transporter ATP-binding protein [bacterium]MBU1753430.1 ABC transporter ATP-binding protein [bacterium]